MKRSVIVYLQLLYRFVGFHKIINLFCILFSWNMLGVPEHFFIVLLYADFCLFCIFKLEFTSFTFWRVFCCFWIFIVNVAVVDFTQIIIFTFVLGVL